MKLKAVIMGFETYPPKIGGISTHVYYLVKYLSKKGVSCYIFPQDVHEDRPRFFQILQKIVSTFHAILNIKSITKVSKIHIYHAHNQLSAFLLLIFGYRPLIYTMHGCASAYNRKTLATHWPFPVVLLLRFFEKVLIKKVDALIAVDKTSYNYVIKKRKNNVYWIPNGVEIPPPSKEKPPFFPTNKIIIIGIGRIIPIKGFQDLIVSYKKLPQTVREKAELFIIGEGYFLDALQELIDEKDKDIHLLGYVEHHKVMEILQHTDIFVLPSHAEGLPYTLLEAMSTKTACIATDVGGISEIFQDKKDLLIIPPKDIESLCLALRYLIENKEIRKKYALNAYKKVHLIFSWDRIIDEIYIVYEKVSKNIQKIDYK